CARRIYYSKRGNAMDYW
nr:immunoglobulin heavy chain junction region [Mus musculus]MBK4195051.1 immunoglobulin heavy chain junction region [Mus musculus]